MPDTLREYNDGSLAQKDDGLKYNIPTTRMVSKHLIDLKRKGM